jgi:PAS domain S-box-containing protein
MTSMGCDAPDSPEVLVEQRYAKLYEMLLDAIPSSVLLINSDLRILSANRNFLERSRAALSSTLGCRLQDVFPPGILDCTNILLRIQQVFKTHSPSHGERITYRAPGLPMRFYYFRVIPFMGKTGVESVLLLMDDVTEQVRLSEEVRRVERHLVSVVESARDIVLSATTDGRITTWNSAAEQLSGYGLHEVKDQLFVDFCAERHQMALRRALEALNAGRASQRGEWHLVTKSGATLPVSWVCSPMCDDGGRTTGIVAVGRDLTEYRKLEMQLMQSQKLAALGVMAGGIAHEIRNPLAICSSAAQFMLEEDISDDFRQECVEDIQASILKASAIIENMLRFARPTTRTDLLPVDVTPLLQETLQLIANQAGAHQITVMTDFPPDPVRIEGIANLLQQVFVNLTLNAIAAIPDGGILKIRVVQSPANVIVQVEDTGCGIPEADISKVFDPFYTTAVSGKGTGLGLSICYAIVKEHRGTIEAQSIVGKGSVFSVRLPALREDGCTPD